MKSNISMPVPALIAALLGAVLIGGLGVWTYGAWPRPDVPQSLAEDADVEVARAQTLGITESGAFGTDKLESYADSPWRLHSRTDQEFRLWGHRDSHGLMAMAYGDRDDISALKITLPLGDEGDDRWLLELEWAAEVIGRAVGADRDWVIKFVKEGMGGPMNPLTATRVNGHYVVMIYDGDANTGSVTMTFYVG